MGGEELTRGDPVSLCLGDGLVVHRSTTGTHKVPNLRPAMVGTPAPYPGSKTGSKNGTLHVVPHHKLSV